MSCLYQRKEGVCGTPAGMFQEQKVLLGVVESLDTCWTEQKRQALAELISSHLISRLKTGEKIPIR